MAVGRRFRPIARQNAKVGVVALAAACCVAGALSGCAGSQDGSRIAPAATGLSPASGPPDSAASLGAGSPSPSDPPGQEPEAPPSSSPSPSKCGPAASATSAAVGQQLLVRAKSAKTTDDGTVVLTYLPAMLQCDSGGTGKFVTTGKTAQTATVQATAVVLMIPPGRDTAAQIPAAAMPAAMKADHYDLYFAIDLDAAGTITRVEEQPRR